MLFCHFVPLSEILVDLLLVVVVVQVLRLCAPFRQSGFASFIDFFSSLALLAATPSLFCVFWRRLLQQYFVVVYCSRFTSSTSNATAQLAPLRDHWFAVGARVPQRRSLQQPGLLFVKVWLHSFWSGRFVASAVRRWSPTPLCETLGCVHSPSERIHRSLRPRRGPLVRPTPLGIHRLSCFSVV